MMKMVLFHYTKLEDVGLLVEGKAFGMSLSCWFFLPSWFMMYDTWVHGGWAFL